MSKRAKRDNTTGTVKVTVKSFEPRGDNQTKCVYTMSEKVLTIIIGPSGCGKTFLSCGKAAQELISGNVNKIFITRPMVQCGRIRDNLGSLPGELDDKFTPFVRPVYDNLQLFLGKQRFQELKYNNEIEFCPIELCRGRSLEDCFIIVDEVENCTYEQLKLMVSRIGKGSQMVMTGDLKQSDLFGDELALEDFINKIKHLNKVGICHLNVDDIQRHPIVGDLLIALEG